MNRLRDIKTAKAARIDMLFEGGAIKIVLLFFESSAKIFNH